MISLKNIDFKNEKLINFIFPIEFIFSIILSISIYLFVCSRNYNNAIKYEYIVSIILFSIMIIALIFINFKYNKNRIEKIFLSFIIPVGMLYMILINPTYVPDEIAHIWKSYQISEGKVITPIDENGKSYIDVPKTISTIIIGTYKEKNEIIKEKTDYNDKVQVESTAQAYSPALYIFSSIAFLLARILRINGIIAEYFAKSLNYIFFLICAYYSIKKIPFGKLTLSCFFFIPMVLQQATSVSADSVLNSVSILFIVFNLYLLFLKDEINSKDIILYVIMSVFLGMAKLVYIPLTGLSLLLINNKKIVNKKNIKILVIVSICVSLVVALGWYMFQMKYNNIDERETYLKENNINSSEQIKWILNNPISAMKVFFNTICNKGESYIFMFLGRELGWLDIKISNVTILAILILIMLAPFLEKNEVELSKFQKLWIICIFAITVATTIMSLYIIWTSIGANEVEGVQGRYFIPIAILPLLCLCMKENYVKIKNINVIMMSLLTISNMFVINRIVIFFAK